MSTSAHAPVSGNTVQSIAMWLWLMLYKLSGGAVARDIGFGSFLLIRNMQCGDVKRFLPDRECLMLLTDLLSSLWTTANKVKEMMDQHPVCLWPSTLVALCEWMQLKECLSVETLIYLATHSSPHLIRAIQGECLQMQPQPSCSRYMVQQVIAREPACRGIQVWQRQERRLVSVPRQTVANQVEVHQRQKQEQHKKSNTQAEQPKNTGVHGSASDWSIENDLDVWAFSNSEAMKTSTEQTHDLSQLLSITAPVDHAVAPCLPASVMPAEVVEPTPRVCTARVEMETRTRSRKRVAAADSSAQEGKKQKVLQWLEAVQQHRCPNTPCTKCTRRGNWCIKGSVSKNIFSYVSLYKRKLTISEPAVEAMAKFIDALE